MEEEEARVESAGRFVDVNGLSWEMPEKKMKGEAGWVKKLRHRGIWRGESLWPKEEDL